jgi:Uncharacterized protein conserved in bacteria (DUF2145)
VAMRLPFVIRCLLHKRYLRRFVAVFSRLVLLFTVLTANRWIVAIAAPVSEVADLPFTGLPVKPPLEKNDPVKLALIHDLSAWVQRTLEANHADVGVVSRQGPPLTVVIDKTGMTHSGIVFRHPVTHDWTVYGLYSNPYDAYRTAVLWQQDLDDFFYGQRTDKKDALLLIPPETVQRRWLARVAHEPFSRLLPEKSHYNLIAPLEHPFSFNCTKWLWLQLMAAKEGTDNIPALLTMIQHDYPIARHKPNVAVRWYLKRKPDVIWRELKPCDTVHTVTVQSLYQSSFFEKRFLYSQSR